MTGRCIIGIDGVEIMARILICSSVIIIILLTNCQSASSISPYLFDKELADERYSDFFYSKTNTRANIPNGPNNITSINYFSDGKMLYSTFWLQHNITLNPPYKEVDYGIFMDSDFDNNTGFNGIDYQVQIGWNKTSQRWDYSIERWTINGDTQRIFEIKNFTNFYKINKNYVSVFVDLSKIHFPPSYKAFFYSDFRLDSGKLVIDTTPWITIPPLELLLTTNSKSVNIFKGEKINVELSLNSTKGYEPVVSLVTFPEKKGINTQFIPRNQTTLPIWGTSTLPVEISVNNSATTGPNTIYIMANSSFPPGDFLKIEGINVPSQNITTITSLVVNVVELNPLDFLEMIANKLGGFTQLIISIITFLAGFGLFKLKQSRKDKKLTDF
jgi:hypothetical protein